MLKRREQIALWTFEGAPLFEDGESIKPEFAFIDPVPEIVMYNQHIDDDGKSGIAYTDINGIPHAPSRAISWKDIRGSGPDADLHLTFDTTGWREIRIRFDYRAESADSFDVAIAENGNWKQVVKNHTLLPDYRWHQTEIDLGILETINDNGEVTVRLYDFVRHGNDRLVLDNVEITGVRQNGEPHTIRMVDLPEGITAVIGDEQQPPYNEDEGFYFHISDPDSAPETVKVRVESMDEDIIDDVDIKRISPKQGTYRLDVGKPAGKVGLTMLVVTASNVHGMVSRVMIPYGASQAGGDETYFSGTSDVSAGISIGHGMMLVGIDEDNILRVYPQKGPSGEVMRIPLVGDEPNTHPLYLTDVKKSGKIREMDIEAATRLYNRVFWMSSHSHNNDGDLRPNRERLFATDLWINEGYVKLDVVGYYDNLRQDIVQWDEEHGLGMRESTLEGVGAKEIEGFNIEGFGIAPDRTTALIGLRVPLLPPDDREDALVLPIKDFTRWFNNGHPVESPTFGDPILLDLGERGIRAMQCTPHGCLIVAGPPGEDGSFALFTWSGSPDDAPQQRAADLSGMRPEAIIISQDSEINAETEIQLLSDNGSADWYDTGEESADMIPPLQKFRSDTVKIGEVVETS